GGGGAGGAARGGGGGGPRRPAGAPGPRRGGGGAPAAAPAGPAPAAPAARHAAAAIHAAGEGRAAPVPAAAAAAASRGEALAGRDTGRPAAALPETGGGAARHGGARARRREPPARGLPARGAPERRGARGARAPRRSSRGAPARALRARCARSEVRRAGAAKLRACPRAGSLGPGRNAAMKRDGFLSLTLRSGVETAIVPAHLDCLSGAGRPSSRRDRGRIDAAAVKWAEGAGFRRIFPHRRSLGGPGEHQAGYSDEEEALGLSRSYQIELAQPEADRSLREALRDLASVEECQVQTLATAPLDTGAPHRIVSRDQALQAQRRI